MPRRYSTRLLVCLTTLSGVMYSTGCGDRARASETVHSEPVEVRLVPVRTGEAQRTIEVTGTLFGEQEVSVAAQVGGRVVEIWAELGDAVGYGGLLVRIDPTDFELAMEEQRASLAAALAKVGLESLPDGEVDITRLPPVLRAAAEESNASARLERARKLYERVPPLISDQDFADIQTSYEVAQTGAAVELLNARSLVAEARVRASALRAAEKRLSDTRVIAPGELALEYKVAERLVSVGEVVEPGQTLYRLVAIERVKFRGVVPERFGSSITPGAKAWLLVDSFEEPFEATVSRVAPAVDIATRSFEIEIGAENRDGRLKPGSFVRARVVLEVDHDARFVPDSAVSQFAGVERVYSVEDGKIIEHRGRFGHASNGEREVMESLDGVDAVVDRPRGLAPGVEVRVAEQTLGDSSD